MWDHLSVFIYLYEIYLYGISQWDFYLYEIYVYEIYLYEIYLYEIYLSEFDLYEICAASWFACASKSESELESELEDEEDELAMLATDWRNRPALPHSSQKHQSIGFWQMLAS